MYKITATNSKLILIDDETPTDVIELIKKECPDTVIYNVSELLNTDNKFSSDESSKEKLHKSIEFDKKTI